MYVFYTYWTSLQNMSQFTFNRNKKEIVTHLVVRYYNKYYFIIYV